MKSKLKLTAFCFGLLVLTSPFAAVIAMPRAGAQPSMGNFVPGTVQCGGYIAARGFIPAVKFSGTLETTEDSVLAVSDKEQWAKVRGVVQVWINGKEQQRIPATAIPASAGQRILYAVPAGHADIYIVVSNPRLSDEITVWIAPELQGPYNSLAVGKASEEECTPTSNPQPN